MLLIPFGLIRSVHVRVVLLHLHLLDYNRQTVWAVVGEGVRLPSDDVGIEMILTQVTLDKLRDIFNIL